METETKLEVTRNKKINKFANTRDYVLTIAEDTDFENWKQLTESLIQEEHKTEHQRQQIQFMIGDALEFGERKFGEAYAQAVDGTIYDPKTLANYARVCKSIPPENRHTKLTFGHHEAVAALPLEVQAEVMDEAEEKKLTVRETRKLAKEKNPKPRKPKKEKKIQTSEETEEIEDSQELLVNEATEQAMKALETLVKQDPKKLDKAQRAKMSNVIKKCKQLVKKYETNKQPDVSGGKE